MVNECLIRKTSVGVVLTFTPPKSAKVLSRSGLVGPYKGAIRSVDFFALEQMRRPHMLQLRDDGALKDC